MKNKSALKQTSSGRPAAGSVAFAALIRSAHAEARQDERHLPDCQIEFALRWGTRLHRRGATFYHVRRKDLPWWLDERAARRYYGTTVVVAGGVFVTAYRKPEGFHALKRTPRRCRWHRASDGSEMRSVTDWGQGGM